MLDFTVNDICVTLVTFLYNSVDVIIVSIIFCLRPCEIRMHGALADCEQLNE